MAGDVDSMEWPANDELAQCRSAPSMPTSRSHGFTCADQHAMSHYEGFDQRATRNARPSTRLRVHHFHDLQKRNLRARVSPPFSLNSTALFSCERVFELTLRAHSRPPTDVTTPRVTDAPFPLHIR